MDLPGPLDGALEGEAVLTRLTLGSDDQLVVTPTRTLRYQAEGILSEESVGEFPHELTTLAIDRGRRKTRFTLSYPLQDTREFTVPVEYTDETLEAILVGVLTNEGVLAEEESIRASFRFGELTVVVTSHRLVTHVGSVAWDEDWDVIPYEEVTDLTLEEGQVTSQLVLTVDGRQERLKVPADEAAKLRHHLVRALRSYHDVDSLAALTPETESTSDPDPAAAFESEVTPLSTGDTTDEAADMPDTEEDQLDREALLEQLAALEQAIDAQTEALAEQRRTIESLRTELED